MNRLTLSRCNAGGRRISACALGVMLAVTPLTIPLCAQSTSQQGPYRMEIVLERRDGNVWRAVDPGLVLDQNDRVRFRFQTNFSGHLYVMNQSTSGTYSLLFPRDETGRDNQVQAGKEYLVPATQAWRAPDTPCRLAPDYRAPFRHEETAASTCQRCSGSSRRDGR